MKQIPVVDQQVIEMFKLAYKRRYPHQDFPKDLQGSIGKMLRRRIAGALDEWMTFMGGTEQKFVLLVDQYRFTIHKEPLRISSISAVGSESDKDYADSQEGEPLDFGKVRFTHHALLCFTKGFPQYVNGDVTESATAILKKASEWRAISDRHRARRVVERGPARFFRFEKCRFVVAERDQDIQLVVTIEEAVWK